MLLCYWCFNLIGETNGIQQTNTGHDNTEHASTTNLTCIFI